MSASTNIRSYVWSSNLSSDLIAAPLWTVIFSPSLVLLNQLFAVFICFSINSQQSIVPFSGNAPAIFNALYPVNIPISNTFFDFDIVDRSNLERQILHQNDDIGRPKVESARETLLSHNPNIDVTLHEAPLTSDNAFEVMESYDIIVNGADNFATRYLVNDAAYLLNKPLVDGSILMFDGQVTTYIPGKSCYRCLYPAPPPPGLVPSCAEAGVLGAMCATIGSIQATEVLKLVLEQGEPLINRLLLYDALSLEFRTVKIRRDPNCPLCGDSPTIHELIDYEQFCGSPFPHPED